MNRGLSSRETLGWISLLALLTGAGALVSVYWNNELLAVLSVMTVTGVLVMARVFGHIELLLINNRLVSFGRSFTRRATGNQAQQSTVRLQGSREWEQLWQQLTETAQEMDLSSIELQVNVPDVSEGYFASWKRRSASGQDDDMWRLELPLFGRGRVVGKLSLTASRDAGPVCKEIARVAEFIEPLECRVDGLLDAGSPVAAGEPAIAKN